MDTKKLRQKILDLAIHGKLVPQDPNDEPASVLLERIRAEKERLIAEGKIKRSKKSSASDTSHYENVPFDVPKGWCWVHLKDIASFGGGKTPSMENKEYWDNGTHLWVTSKDMKTSVINDSMMKISDEALKTMQVYQPGTLLMVTRSGILKRMLPLAILGKRATVNQDLKTISIVTPILPIYVFYTILANESMILRDYHKDGTTVDSINFDKFVEMSIPLPPQNEQKRIVDAIEHYLSLIEDIKHSEDDILVCIDSAKSKILDLAIHGKLVSQDANDEPASELLKRINPKAVASCDNPQYEQIPDGWSVCALDYIADILNGYAFKSDKYVDNGIRVIRIMNVQDGYIEDDSPKYYPMELLQEIKNYILNDGDLLMSLTGNVGRVGVISKQFLPAALNQRVACIRITAEINKEYLYYVFLSNTFKKDSVKSSKGVAQLNMSTEWLKQYKICIPPYNEQIRIVSKVKELFSQLEMIEKSLQA